MRGHFPELKPSAARRMTEQFKLERRAVEILELVVSEWNSDPLSVQCFDLRIVKESKGIVKRLRELRDF